MESVLRVSQLDACELDENIAAILQHQFLEIFRIIESAHIHQLRPELEAFVRFLVWKFSLQTANSTFGQRMLSLTYITEKSKPLTFFQNGGLFISFILVEWLRERCGWLITKFPGLFAVQRLLDYSTTALKTLSLLNFVVFLVQGHYPTLKERILGLTMASTSPQSIQEISHSYLTREILWHGFSEFVFFLLPHLNIFSLRNWARRVLKTSAPSDPNQCSFCETPPTLPHFSDCGHLYCYYCLRANLMPDTKFPCYVCNKVVSTCTPASEATS